MSRFGYGIPEIYESEAVGVLAQIYLDIKHVLKVPIVNFLFRVIALYEEFLSIAWNQVRYNMITLNVEKYTESLRNPNIPFNPAATNWLQYYDYETIGKIKKIVFTFNYVNPKLLIIASAWAEALSNRPIKGTQNCAGWISPGITPGLPQINLVNINEAPVSTRRLMLDIAHKHHAFDIASDFRALANFPEFLTISWKQLSNYVGTKDYNLMTTNIKNKSIEIAHNMPLPVTIDRITLESIYSPSKFAGIVGIVTMFQNFLPDLIIDGEFFRRIIDSE